MSLIELPRALGVVAIFNIFLVVLTVFVTRLIWVHERYGVPVIVLLLGLAVLFSWYNWNDNHSVDSVASTKPYRVHFRDATPTAEKVQWLPAEAFQEWIASRPDREAYARSGKRYPVFLVSAAGGGLYAAQHAATVLSRIQDHCPHFAQHIFTISGVSGGSLGAATFATIAQREAKPVDKPSCGLGTGRAGPIEQLSGKFLSQDFLSPVVAATLFPDFLQRFWPRPIQRFDRAKVLDSAFERAWSDTFPNDRGPNPFASMSHDYWSPTGVAPAVLLNATQVGSGGRVVMSPFKPHDTNDYMAKITWLAPGNNEALQTTFDNKLSSAVGISARFPWVMPAATVGTSSGTMRLVDGGYFENSGVETTYELYLALQPWLRDNPNQVELHLLNIFSFGGDTSVEGGGDTLAMGEIYSPLKALMSTRQARADFAVLRSVLHICRPPDCDSDPSTVATYVGTPWDFSAINQKDFNLPLSWQLSAFSRQVIGLHAGVAGECQRTGVDKHLFWSAFSAQSERVPRALSAASCTLASICNKLATTTLDLPMDGAIGPMACGDWGRPTAVMPANPVK